MKKALILALLVGVLFTTSHVQGQESRSEEAIQEAITLLEARHALADKADDKERITRAIEALKATLPGAAPPNPGPALPKLTTADFRKKLKGRVVYDEKTGELTLIYDLKQPSQLDDFDVKADRKTVERGAVILQGGESATHVVRFETLTAAGTIHFKNAGGSHVSTTGGYGIASTRPVGDYTRMFVFAGKDRAEAPQVHVPQWTKQSYPFKLTITTDRVGCQIGRTQLGTAIEDETLGNAGQFVLQAVNGPSAFGNIVLTGKVDVEWAKTFLAP